MDIMRPVIRVMLLALPAVLAAAPALAAAGPDEAVRRPDAAGSAFAAPPAARAGCPPAPARPVPVSPGGGAEDSDARTPEEAAGQWMAALSGMPGLESWKTAGLKMSALGPGRHGWLALVVDGRETVGHLIIAAKPDGGFVLTACGPGEPPADVP